MNEGVMPNPSGDSGSSGGRPTAGSPGHEEQQAESRPFGAPSSGAAPKDDRVPKERFQEIYQRMKEAEDKLAQMSAPQPTTVKAGRPGYEDQISQWRDVAEQAFGQNPAEFTNALNQMSALQAKSAASEMMEQFLQHQQVETQKQSFQSESEQWWGKAQADFPELKDQNSEFYRKAYEVWAGDPALQANPRGMYYAADSAFSARARSGVTKPPSMEGSKGQSLTPQQADSLESEAAQTLDQLKGGNQVALQNFLAKNMEKLLYSDGMPRKQ